MPRLNSGSELFKYLNSVKKYVVAGSGANTTTTEAITVGMLDTDVAAITGGAAGDYVLISGDGGVELTKISSAAGTNFVWDRPLAIAQSSGADVDEATEINLGHVEESGATFGGTYSLTPINAATSRVALASLAESAELTFEIPLLGYNNLNLQAAFGVTEAELGAGSSSDPYRVVIGRSTVGTQSSIQAFRLAGVRFDSKNVEIDILEATMEVNANITIGATTPPSLVLSGTCTAFIQRIW